MGRKGDGGFFLKEGFLIHCGLGDPSFRSPCGVFVFVGGEGVLITAGG